MAATPAHHPGARMLRRLTAGVLLVTLGLALGHRAGGQSSHSATVPSPIPQMLDRAGPGPDRIQDGLPRGFARSPEGAVAAATAYAVVLDSPRIIDDAALADTLEVIATHDHRRSLLDDLTGATAILVERLDLRPDRDLVWHSVPAAWRVATYDDRRATVDVWGTGVLVIDGLSPAPPGWRTTRVELRWERGDWKLVGLSGSPGPAPPGQGDQPGSGLFEHELAGFEPFLHVPAWEEIR